MEETYSLANDLTVENSLGEIYFVITMQVRYHNLPNVSAKLELQLSYSLVKRMDVYNGTGSFPKFPGGTPLHNK